MNSPLPTKQGYDLWSAGYDADANPLITLENTLFADLLGDVRDRNLLDIGCGTGRHSIPLAEAGARVTGVDFSEGMLTKARAKAAALTGATGGGVRFVAHDLHDRLPLPDHTFHVVLCALVLEHIKSLDHLFSEFERLTQPGGRVVITVMHPAMFLRGVQARFLPDAARENGTDEDKLTIDTVPHTIADYVNAAVGAGLAIDRVGEHAMPESLGATHPRAARYVGWPMLLTMRLRR